MNHKRDQNKALLEVWEILSRYRWRFVAPAFIVAALVLAVSLALPRKYKAEATFERRTDMVFTEITTKGATRTVQDPRGSLTTEIAGQTAINSLMNYLEPKLRDRGILLTESERHDLARDILLRTIVHWDVSSSTMDRIRVEYIGSDPEIARLVANGLVKQYIERTRLQMAGQLEASAGFFQQEVARHRENIEKAENQVLQFELAHSELLPDNPNNVQAKLGETQTNLVELISLRDAAATRAQSLRESIEQTPKTSPVVVTGTNPALAELELAIREQKTRIAQFVEQYKMTDQHPDLAGARQQLAALQETLANTDREVVTETQVKENPKRVELEMRLTAADSEFKALSQQVESIKRQIAEMNGQVAQVFTIRSDYQRLRRQVDEAQRQLAFWEDNLRRVQMALAAEHGDRAIQLSFVQPAHTPRKPVSPALAQVLAAALAMGLLAGGLNVFLAYRTDESYSNGEELARDCNLPLIGAVSELVTQKHRRMRRLRSAIIVPANVLGMAAVLGVITTLLYLDLEKPDTFERVKGAATALVAPDEEETQLLPRPQDNLTAVDPDAVH